MKNSMRLFARITTLTLVAGFVVSAVQPASAATTIVTNKAEQYSLAVSFRLGNGDSSNWKLERRKVGSAQDAPTRFTRSMDYIGGERGVYSMTVVKLDTPPISYLSWRSKKALRNSWSSFVKTYIDEWYHEKNSDGQEIHGSEFRVREVAPITMRSYTATRMSVREQSGPQYHRRHRTVLVTKDKKTVYKIQYTLFTMNNQSITDAKFNRYLSDFDALLKSFKIL